MPTEASRRQRQTLLGLIIVILVFLLLFGFGSTPASAGLVAPPWDKFVHLGVFAALTVGLCALMPALPWPLIIVLTLAVAAGDELHQFLVPMRQPAWDDGVADLVGATCGLAAWRWWLLRRQARTSACAG